MGQYQLVNAEFKNACLVVVYLFVSAKQEAYESAVRSFCDLAAASVALYHKVAQLLLIEKSGNPLLSYKFRALSLVGYAAVVGSLYCLLLLLHSPPLDDISSLMTNQRIRGTVIRTVPCYASMRTHTDRSCSMLSI